MQRFFVWKLFGLFWCRFVVGNALFGAVDLGSFGRNLIGGGAHFNQKLLRKAGAYMKIVVVKSPRLLGGLLRMLFGIKKETYPE